MKKPHDGSDMGTLRERAKRYGIDLEPSALEDRVLEQGERLVLSSAPGKHCKDGPTHVLETEDLDQVKQWIGIPDAVAEQRCCRPGHAASRGWLLHAKNDATLARSAKRADPDFVHRLAHEYIYGDSRRVVAYKPLIERFYGRFKIPNWFFRNIVVGPGAVLEFTTSNPVVLLANRIEIAATGRIVSHSSLNVDCVNVQQMT